MEKFELYKTSYNKNIGKRAWRNIGETLYFLKSLILDTRQGDTIKTQRIKVELAKLGHNLKHRVYANKLSQEQVNEIGHGFINTEWLYDIHWYRDLKKRDYVPERLIMAGEFEWEKKRPKDLTVSFSGIKFDFQKLLMCNAELCMMICRLSNLDEMNELGLYFNTAILKYKRLKENTQFLFICYNQKDKEMYFMNILK